MGKPIAGGDDFAEALAAGSLSATGVSLAVEMDAPFNLSVWGSPGGAWAIERSFDGGTTWIPLSLSDGSANAFNGNVTLPILNVFEAGVLYRINWTRTSGTLFWRMSR